MWAESLRLRVEDGRSLSPGLSVCVRVWSMSVSCGARTGEANGGQCSPVQSSRPERAPQEKQKEKPKKASKQARTRAQRAGGVSRAGARPSARQQQKKRRSFFRFRFPPLLVLLGRSLARWDGRAGAHSRGGGDKQTRRERTERKRRGRRGGGGAGPRESALTSAQASGGFQLDWRASCSCRPAPAGPLGMGMWSRECRANIERASERASGPAVIAPCSAVQ